AILKGNLAIVRNDASVEKFKKSGLAGAVASDQSNAFASLQGKTDAIKEGVPIAKLDTIESK
ncbi:MAG: hypothetical protein RLZZ627_189, partial [Pseudomonadota bacterium]